MINSEMKVEEAINARYSTRNYKKGEKIDREIVNKILDAGFSAPSGLGTEPWKFIVLENNLSSLGEAVYNQEHVLNSSFIVVLLNLKQSYVDENPNIMYDKWEESGLPISQQEQSFGYLKYAGTQYYREQLMFAASFMTLQATALNIGSVVVGGFDADKLSKLIEFDQDKYEIGLLVDFGISNDSNAKERIRRDRSDVVEFQTIKS